MKKFFVTLLAFTLTLSSSALAAANPFDAFAGSFVPQSTPVITSGGSNTCTWINFAGITGMNLEKGAREYYQFSLSSLDHNSPMTIRWDFKEFDIRDQMGTSNTGEITSAPGMAQYRMRNATPESLEVYSFHISQNESGTFHLTLSYQMRDPFSGLSACTYQVDLTKQP
ncbi:MAG: hypothetical protein H7333_12630 [Bdellovibrionales bacterium]|nr:hypothetical protein [Oligoflexia bacterium]